MRRRFVWAHFLVRGDRNALKMRNLLSIFPDRCKKRLGLLGFLFVHARSRAQASDHIKAKVTPFFKLNAQVSFGECLCKASCGQIGDGLDVHVRGKTQLFYSRDGLLRRHQVALHAEHLAQDSLQIVQVHLTLFTDAQLSRREHGHQLFGFRRHAAARQSRSAIDGTAVETLLDRTSIGATHNKIQNAKGKMGTSFADV